MIYQAGVLSDERRTVSWLTLQSDSGKNFITEKYALRANPECGIFRYYCAEVTVVRNFSVYNTVFLSRVPGVLPKAHFSVRRYGQYVYGYRRRTLSDRDLDFRQIVFLVFAIPASVDVSFAYGVGDFVSLFLDVV